MSGAKSRASQAPVVKLEDCDWLRRATTQQVFACLQEAGFEARAVGGCVRNALLGRPVKDIDFATTAKPDQTMEAAQAAGLKALPTGIDHGTITILVDHVPHEVTTLRRDVATDGRRAEVAFTDDWALDAQRRDFTVNAFYADAGGNVFDPVDGYPDLRAGRIRFIGRPEDRIREDYLRILRFFRFTAEYGGGTFDEASLEAAVELKQGLDQLAGERLQQELFALMTAAAVSEVAATMQASGIFDQILGLYADVPALIRLIAIEKNLNCAPDPLRRLAALFVRTGSDADHLRDRLKLSNRHLERLHHMATVNPATKPGLSEAKFRAALYRVGREPFQDQLLIDWATSGASSTDEARAKLYFAAGQWRPPEFPLHGDDVLAIGIDPGPRVGALLAAVEQWWIERDFKPTRDMLIDKLHERSKG